MRSSLRRLASHTPLTAPNLLRPEPIALLPPIPLFRRVLRAHRKLPRDMRLLGDEYVKIEFRSHRNVDNPVHIVCSRQMPAKGFTMEQGLANQRLELQIGFLTEWQSYAQQLEGDGWRDAKLDKGKIDKMSGGYYYHAIPYKIASRSSKC